jgi:hypothetical protein
VFTRAADNNIGDSGCSALAEALPHLSALQELHLNGNYYFYFLSCLRLDWGHASWAAGFVFTRAAGNDIGDSGCSALAEALPHLSALQELHLGSNYYFYFLSCLRLDWGHASWAAGYVFTRASVNSIGPSGCSALAEALPHLSALQVLVLLGNCYF